MYINLTNKYTNVYASYWDKIVKQSCYFAKICDGEFNKKFMGVNLFSLQHCVHEQMLKNMCEIFNMLGVTS